jgi:protein-tyrosine kinase
MSVIENALKKLQASQGHGSRNAANPINPHGVFGAVVVGTGGGAARRREGQASGAAEPVVPGRIVAVNQSALRVAGLLPPEHQQAELAREYRRIKRPLLANALGRGSARVPNGNLIMVASAMPGDGKTFMSLNLAFSIRLEEDFTVLLVDGDVAKPQISKLLGVDKELGLLDVLRDPKLDIESVVLPTDVPGLSVLPAGRHAENATELLASARMREVLDALGGRHPERIVLFDSPPLLITTESQALGGVLGQVVIVVRADHTPQSALLEALEFLGDHQHVSLVLNQTMRAPISNYYQYYNNDEAQSEASPPPR